MIQIPIEMPDNCHMCDSVGISDICGFECPVNQKLHEYCFTKRPEACPLKELTEKEKTYLYDILCKQDWTETAICDAIIKKLKLSKYI